MNKQRLVIALDGHDGSGKTTLAKKLATALGGITLRPFAGQSGTALLEAGQQQDVSRLVELGSTAIRACINSADPDMPIVLDRAWLTVASFVPDNADFFKLWPLKIPTALCWVNLKNTQIRLNERTYEQAATLDWHRHYLNTYQVLAERFNIPIIRTDQQDVETCLAQLEHWAKNQAAMPILRKKTE